MESQTLLWLDDERDPTDARWHAYLPISQPTIIWVKSFDEFVAWISNNGMPNAICFDHDLGDGPSGFDAAKWLTEYCLDNGSRIPAWNIQRANPIGKDNIASLRRDAAASLQFPLNLVPGFEKIALKQFRYDALADTTAVALR